MRFHIQQESDIPASTQLSNQICFAIAARHYPPGHRLPSTRQLAMQTGLHRNTISKVYRQLEIDGVVEAVAGSGIYVRDNLTKKDFKSESNLLLFSEIAVIRINSLPRMLCMITSAALNKPGLILTMPTQLPAFNSLRIFNSF